MPIPAIIAAIGRTLPALMRGAGQYFATAGTRAASSAAATSGRAAASSAAAAGQSATARTAAGAAQAATAQNAATTAQSAATQATGTTRAAQAAANAGAVPNTATSSTSSSLTFNRVIQSALSPINTPGGQFMGSIGSAAMDSMQSGPGFGGLRQAIAGEVDTGTLTKAATGDPAAITKTIMELGKMPARLRDFGSALLRSQDGLVAFSGRMANAAMKLEAERYGRAMRTAAATGASYAQLTGAQSRLEERLQPYQAAYQSVVNRVSAAVLTIADTVVSGFEHITRIRAILARWLPELGKEPEAPILNKVIRDVARGDKVERAREPLGERK